jgi:uncharacterized protein
MNETHDIPSSGSAGGNRKRQSFRILSLDGGGIRGTFTAAFLEGVEDRLGMPVAGFFDMIAGTSTGAIIAVALAMGLTATDVVTMYRTFGRNIFTRRHRSWWRRLRDVPSNLILSRFDLDWDALLRSKYGSAALANAVEEVLGDHRLEAAQRRLIVPSVRTSLGRPIVFRTPHFENQDRDRHLTAVDVILATTAAPTYFPPHWIEDKHAEGQYVDGGLWANHPGLLAYSEAVRISRECRRSVDPRFTAEDVMVLSLGTGESPSAFRLPEGQAGVLRWAPHLLDLMMVSQSQGTHRMLRYLLPDARYHRINFIHESEGWELDAIEQLDVLIANGRSEARNMFNRIPPGFFHGDAPQFVPFPPATKHGAEPEPSR